MTPWRQADSEIYRAIADVAVPRRREMTAALVASVPFETSAPLKIIELGSGDGQLAEVLLRRFPQATLTALDASESMRTSAAVRLQSFDARARVAAFDLASLDWWDRMDGADLVISSMCLHHLNDAKKQYLYKAAGDRMSSTGALLVADIIQPQHPAAVAAAAEQWDEAARQQADALGRPELLTRFREARWNLFRYPDDDDRPAALLHHLMWLRHAGFAAVDCIWLDAGHAVFGGFKRAAASGLQLPADS